MTGLRSEGNVEVRRQRVVRVSVVMIGVIAAFWVVFNAFWLWWFVRQQVIFWHHVAHHR